MAAFFHGAVNGIFLGSFFGIRIFCAYQNAGQSPLCLGLVLIVPNSNGISRNISPISAYRAAYCPKPSRGRMGRYLRGIPASARSVVLVCRILIFSSFGPILTVEPLISTKSGCPTATYVSTIKLIYPCNGAYRIDRPGYSTNVYFVRIRPMTFQC